MDCRAAGAGRRRCGEARWSACRFWRLRQGKIGVGRLGFLGALEAALLIRIQLAIPPGTYQLRVGLYDPVSSARLAASDDQGIRFADDAITLGEITVP